MADNPPAPCLSGRIFAFVESSGQFEATVSSSYVQLISLLRRSLHALVKLDVVKLENLGFGRSLGFQIHPDADISFLFRPT